MKLTVRLHLVLRLRVSGAVPLLHLCTFMVQTGTTVLSLTVVGRILLLFLRKEEEVEDISCGLLLYTVSAVC